MPRRGSPLQGLMHREWWTGVSGLAAIVGLALAVVQIVLDQRIRVPLAALAAASLLLAAVLVVLARRPRQRVLIINDYRQDAARYYQTVCQVLSNVRYELYYAGGGFHGRDQSSREYGAQVNRATDAALRAGARLYRIQTSDRTGREFAQGLADMVRDHPGRASVYGDFGPSAFVDVGVYDPDEPDCVVQIVIKAERTYGVGGDARAGGTLFIFGNRELARGLHRLFVKRLKSLGTPMTADEIRALGAERDRGQPV